MTTALENILVVLSVAIEKDEISKAELRRTLGAIGTAIGGEGPSDGYLATAHKTGDECLAILKLNDRLSAQYEHCFQIWYGKDQ